MSEKIMTVLGPLDPENLGCTLMHEHLLINLLCYYDPPKTPAESEQALEPVQLRNLGRMRQKPYSNRDNLVLDQEQTAIEELNYFKNLGGRALVEVTSEGIGRNPEGLQRISRATGVHIVAGCGYYVSSSHPPNLTERSIESLTEEITRDLLEGIAGTGIRAGIIGEIGTSYPLHPDEEKCLRAAVRAQRRTGVCLCIHPAPQESAPFEVARVLEEENADWPKVVMSHIEDRFRHNLKAYRDLAQRGCYLALDTFGKEEYIPSRKRQRLNDAQRIEILKALLNEGYRDQLLIAQDVCTKMDLRSYGGYGYGHILEHLWPRFLESGIREEDLGYILKENPKRALAIRSLT